jgi:hypothetical protein
VPLGNVNVDKVAVRSIMLQGNHCQCGKLNGGDAGVLTFLTSFSQEKGYRLDQVTVDICFLEHEPNSDNANRKLKLLEFPSPIKAIHGEPRTERVSNKTTVYPKVQVLGNGGELGGNERTYETSFVRSWCYSSNWESDEYGNLTIAKWTWQADEGDPQVQHVGPLYSGVVVGPLCQPFWVGCSIKPRLSRSKPLKWLRRFVGRPNEEESQQAFTKILLNPTDTDLGPLVDGLDVKIHQLMRPNQG